MSRRYTTALTALAGSTGSRRRKARRHRGRRPSSQRERGLALIMVLMAVMLLSVLLVDMHLTTSTAYSVAVQRRDQVRAEYMAKSGLALTRLLVQNEPQITQTVAPFYQLMLGRPPPQLPVWEVANEVLAPFCNQETGDEAAASAGFQIADAQGFDNNPGGCEIIAVAENSKINVNDPLFRDGDDARRSTAMQLFAMTGGYQRQSPFDPLFEQRDRDGNFTSRLDVISSMIDWWDQDTDRTIFDPGAGEISESGGEDDSYQSLDDPYRVKNAPFDSLEELRLIRGVSDDFWATFIEPDPGDPRTRGLTIYGSGAVNVNEGPPEVILARLCSFLDDQPLCTQPEEAAKFIQLVNTVRSMFPIPFFTHSPDFLNFIEGKGGAQDLYPMLQAMLGPDNPLLFAPVTIPTEMRREISISFVTSARIITIQVIGFGGHSGDHGTRHRAEVTITAVLNVHDRWAPPPPNAGRLPALGVLHHYRIE